MGVTVTPNIGLSKPDSTELAENWVSFTALNTANLGIVQTKANTGLTNYTPTFLGNPTAFNVGSGIITGEYTDLQGFVFGRFRIIFIDPGVVAGSGEFAVSLPVTVDGTFHNVGSIINATPGTFSCIGDGYIRDNSVLANCGNLALDVITIAGVSYVRFITETFAGKTSRLLSAGQPLTLADSDSLAGNFFYKRT